MFTSDEIELGRAAMECAKLEGDAHLRVRALRMLRDECGWTLRRADQVLSYVLAVPPLSVSEPTGRAVIADKKEVSA